MIYERREITPDDIAAIAKAVHQPDAAVYGVATYYGDLGMKKRGRTRVKVCKGTACFATCRDASVHWMEEALGVRLGETSADGSVCFPTATKWRFTAANAKKADQAFVVCNADEGDPGSSIDKYLMERDPCAVIVHQR